MGSFIEQLGIAWLGGIGYVEKYLTRLWSKARRQDTELPVEGYFLPPYKAIVQGALFITAGTQVMSFVLGVAIGASGADVVAAIAPIGLLVLVTAAVPLLYIVGVWIGRRVEERPFISIVLAAILARIVTGIFDFILLEDHVWEEVAGTSHSASGFATTTIWGMLVFAFLGVVFGGMGYWRGRSTKYPHYARWLLSQRPHEEQMTLVTDLAVNLNLVSNDDRTLPTPTPGPTRVHPQSDASPAPKSSPKHPQRGSIWVSLGLILILVLGVLAFLSRPDRTPLTSQPSWGGQPEATLTHPEDFQGVWGRARLFWAADERSYTAVITTDGPRGVIDVSFADPRTSLQIIIRQDLHLETDGTDWFYVGSNPRHADTGDSVAARYPPDSFTLAPTSQGLWTVNETCDRNRCAPVTTTPLD
jgi:hypothetical protein